MAAASRLRVEAPAGMVVTIILGVQGTGGIQGGRKRALALKPFAGDAGLLVPVTDSKHKDQKSQKIPQV